MRTPRPWALPTEPATREILAAGGVSDEMIRTRLADGSLLRIRPGVYLAAGSLPTDPAGRHLIRARAEAVIHPTAVISHGSAAIAWGLPTPGFEQWHEGPVSLTEPFGASHGTRRRNGTVLHHVLLRPGDVVRDSAGYDVTSLPRTAVDLARGLALPEALVILDAAARQLCARYVSSPRRSDYRNGKLVDAAIRDLERACGPRSPAALRDALGAVDPARESAAESLSAGHFRVAGLPTPLCQAAVTTPGGTLYPDFFWPQHGLIGECDGAVKYTGAESIVAEKEREQQLRDLGFRMVRWLAKEIMLRPWEVVERVRRELQL